MTLSDLGEFGFIERVRAWTPAGSAPIGIGDDAAVVRGSDGSWLIAACDAMVEDVHFRWSWSSPQDVGYKAVAVNVSDLAAMGAEPRWFLLTLATRPDVDEALLESLYAGVAEACRELGGELVGGDTVRAPVTMIAVTAIGEADGEPMLRSGAQPGDVLAVTGPLGKAGVGLNLLLSKDPTKGPPSESLQCIEAHRRPRVRLQEGRSLRSAGAHAALDISDGLVSDVRRLTEASGVGAEIDLVPVAAEAARVAEARGWDAERIALGAGEDFELLVALPKSMLATVGCDLTVIGRVVEEGLWLVRGGRREELPALGWDAFGHSGAERSP